MELEEQLLEIVRRCADGDRAAFEELFEIYQPRLKYYVRRLDSGGANIDDTLQDIWLSVFKKIHKLKDGRAFGVWLYRIARNKVYDRFRRKDRFVPLPEEDEFAVTETDEPAFGANDAEKMHNALKKLKPYHQVKTQPDRISSNIFRFFDFNGIRAK